MKTLLSIIKKPAYAVTGFFIYIVLYFLISVAPHMRELQDIRLFERSIGGDGSVLREGILSFMLHTTEPTLIATIALSGISTLVILALVYYYRKQGDVLIATSGKGVFGLILGLLGVGCSACGTLALTAVLGTFGLGWVVLLLPLRGTEFLYVGVVIMLFALWQVIKLINKPLTC